MKWILGRQTAVVPAHPGWAIVTLTRDDQPWIEPIVAWQIVTEAASGEIASLVYPVPITIEGIEQGSLTAILRPDGKVVVPRTRTFDSVDAYVRYRREAQDEKATRTSGM